jgi:transposase InsO family protein
VTELFKRHGLVRKRPRRTQLRSEAVPPQPDFSAPNRTWCADFKGQFQLRDRSWCYPLTITDGFSRFLLCCQGFPGTTSDPVQHAFERCFRENGLPDAILTDNGLPFASTAVGRLSRLSVWWIKLGIRLLRIVPGRPQQNGRHERMHRTLKQETADAPADALPGQQPLLDHFRNEYNYDRPHAALGGRSPGHLYLPSPRQMPPKVSAPIYAGHHATRSVHTDGSIRFRGDRVFLSEALIGELVGLEEFDDDRFLLRFGPFELATLDCRADPPTLTRLPGSS